MRTVSIANKTRTNIPRVPFEKIARRVLGRSYELSLVFCGDSLATRLNRQYRKKRYVPNVLSFPLSKTEGEVFLNLKEAACEAKKYGTTLKERVLLLFIHACLHLKGLKHGAKMEKETERMVREYSPTK